MPCAADALFCDSRRPMLLMPCYALLMPYAADALLMPYAADALLMPYAADALLQ